MSLRHFQILYKLELRGETYPILLQENILSMSFTLEERQLPCFDKLDLGGIIPEETEAK